MGRGDGRSSDGACGGPGIRHPRQEHASGSFPDPEGGHSQKGKNSGTAGTHPVVQEAGRLPGGNRGGDRPPEARSWDGTMPVQGVFRGPDERLLGGSGLEYQKVGVPDDRIRAKDLPTRTKSGCSGKNA